jgi:hypothetical protein
MVRGWRAGDGVDRGGRARLPGCGGEERDTTCAAERTPTPTATATEAPDCFVVAPRGDWRIAIFSAADDRRPYRVPSRRKLRSGERVPYNARGRRDGTLVLGG